MSQADRVEDRVRHVGDEAPVTRNYSTFEAAIRCPKEAHPELALPHDPTHSPEFYALNCCLKRGGTNGTLPEGAARPCSGAAAPPWPAERATSVGAATMSGAA